LDVSSYGLSFEQQIDFIKLTYGYDSVVRPMKKYLEEKGVKFEMGKEVVDIDFNLSADKKTTTVIHLKDKTEIVLSKNNFVFITNGSITESTNENPRYNEANYQSREGKLYSWQLVDDEKVLENKEYNKK
jgi:oleate hydratase